MKVIWVSNLGLFSELEVKWKSEHVIEIGLVSYTKNKLELKFKDKVNFMSKVWGSIKDHIKVTS